MAVKQLVDPPQLQWSILRLSHETMPPHLYDADPGHTWWSLYLPDDQGLELHHRHGVSALPVDAVSFIPPWTPFTYRFPADLQHGYIHFAVHHLPGALVRRLFPQPCAIDDTGLLQEMRAVIAALKSPSRGQDHHLIALLTNRLIAGALHRLIEGLEPADRPFLFNPSDHWGRLGPALRYIRLHLCDAIAVADLAAELGVSDKQCTRLFHRHLGQTPMQYCTEQRLQRAAELLLSTDWSLDAIATACGFANAQYLSRQFRRQHGMPPMRWRRRLGN